MFPDPGNCKCLGPISRLRALPPQPRRVPRGGFQGSSVPLLTKCLGCVCFASFRNMNSLIATLCKYELHDNIKKLGVTPWQKGLCVCYRPQIFSASSQPGGCLCGRAGLCAGMAREKLMGKGRGCGQRLHPWSQPSSCSGPRPLCAIWAQTQGAHHDRAQGPGEVLA